MPYATLQDIVDRYGQDLLFEIWDRNHTGVYDATSIADALDTASAEIDGYLAERYDVPVVDLKALAVLNIHAVNMAIYHGCDEGTITELRTDRYNQCIKYLTKVAEGKISLGIEKPPSGGSGAAFITQPRRYGRDKLNGC